MKSLTTKMAAVALTAMMGFGLAACDNNDGPAEQMGEKIDNATTDAGNAIEDACEKTKENVGASDTDC
ncbi:hypothetical protein ACKC9G_12055 [Pokkaliibacter sp. CJK22405]|uniref:hypothetical protein n=1 Tax=Pokkaliibacter sp. CJK22405 TaxID=3384615 RepID=UPI003985057F